MKKRILLVNEASYFSTGFSVYGYEVLNRLLKTGKYELAELGAYGQDDDARWRSLPWKFYPNQPVEGPELKAYNSKPTNQFGEWRFEQTCLDFKPHIVWDIRDWWFAEFMERSPFRPYYKWVIMPTVDSAPQDDQWIASYMGADAVLTYSEFGQNTLTKQGGGLINLQGIASPGANLEDFEVVKNKRSHKKSVGMPEDILVIGTVMRNQERKLYPDLIKAFRMFLDQAPPELAKKTFLYLHTAYPDVGWHIPRFLKEYGVLNKTLLTYYCQNCKAILPSFYQDARAFCKACGQYLCVLPGVNSGISRQNLGKILNIFDAYVQYSVCEGFGMPLVEAGACGVPLFAVDYSAMSDIINNIGGDLIKVERMFCDTKTQSYRALPDNQDLVNKLITLLNQKEEERLERGYATRKKVEKRYSWDTTAQTWEKIFDETDVLPEERSWKAPSRITQPNTNCPPNLNNDEFVQWAVQNIAGRPELLNSYVYLRLVRDLNWGATQIGPGGVYFNEASTQGMQARMGTFDRDNAIQELLTACEHKNAWERIRLGAIHG